MGSFLLGAFLPYAIAESLELSGITAVLFAGIIADYYTSHHLNKESEIASRNTVETLAYLGESFIFIYLGMSFFPASNHVFEPGLMFLTLFLCFVGRGLSVFPLAFVLNCGRKRKVPLKHQIVLWFSGLRGPVAYALAVATPQDEKFPKVDNLIISTTLFVVAFTTFGLGGLAYPFIKCLNVEVMDTSEAAMGNNDNYDISNHWFSKIDKRYLKPYFGPVKRIQHAPPLVLHRSLSRENTPPVGVDFDDDENNNDTNNNSNDAGSGGTGAKGDSSDGAGSSGQDSGAGDGQEMIDVQQNDNKVEEES